jgi:hypothetical protein
MNLSYQMLKQVISNRGFLAGSDTCACYSTGAVFPFYKYGGDLMVNKFGVSERWAGSITKLGSFRHHVFNTVSLEVSTIKKGKVQH